MGIKQRIDQTKRYYKRNGLAKTAVAVTEKVFTKENPEFKYTQTPGEELAHQLFQLGACHCGCFQGP